jgi:hypothetical protein
MGRSEGIHPPGSASRGSGVLRIWDLEQRAVEVERNPSLLDASIARAAEVARGATERADQPFARFVP